MTVAQVTDEMVEKAARAISLSIATIDVGRWLPLWKFEQYQSREDYVEKDWTRHSDAARAALESVADDLRAEEAEACATIIGSDTVRVGSGDELVIARMYGRLRARAANHRANQFSPTSKGDGE